MRAALLQAAESRRSTADVLTWQVPALAFTAQSFLLTIALGRETSDVSRLVAAAVGLVVSYAALHLLLRHSYNERLSSLWLEHYERVHADRVLHNPADLQAVAIGPKLWDSGPASRLIRVKAIYVWAATLAFLVAGNVALTVYAILELSGIVDCNAFGTPSR